MTAPRLLGLLQGAGSSVGSVAEELNNWKSGGFRWLLGTEGRIFETRALLGKQTCRESLTPLGAIAAGDSMEKQGHSLPVSLNSSASKKLPLPLLKPCPPIIRSVQVSFDMRVVSPSVTKGD